MEWYKIDNIGAIDSPSLVLYEDRLEHNLQMMLDMVQGDASKLMPHVKTSKMPNVIARMVNYGIIHFKASTIAEAEMTAGVGAKSVLIAHQLVGPKVERLLALVTKYPNTTFATILDNLESAKHLNALAKAQGVTVAFYIDINSGMDRSGIALGPELNAFIAVLPQLEALMFKGLHVYDGHIREPNFETRRTQVVREFHTVEALFSHLKTQYPSLQLICGGTPTFTSHLCENEHICSPGTCVLWDWGYGDKLSEQMFQHACLLVTRVISKPTEGIVTIDLGHKAVGAENPIGNRVKFLNLCDYELLSQSEEHGVLRVKDWKSLKVGDVLYGVPFHICPTVNLHDEVSVIINHKKTDTWEITARRRKLSI